MKSLRLPDTVVNASETPLSSAPTPDSSSPEIPPYPDNSTPLSAITRIGIGYYQDTSRLLPGHSYITQDTTHKQERTPSALATVSQTQLIPEQERTETKAEGSTPRAKVPAAPKPDVPKPDVPKTDGKTIDPKPLPAVSQASHRPADFNAVLAAYPHAEDRKAFSHNANLLR